MSTKIFATVISAFSALALVAAESHTVSFSNNCGYGTVSVQRLGDSHVAILTQCLIQPILRGQDGSVLSQGEDYTSDGSLDGAIAYVDSLV